MALVLALTTLMALSILATSVIAYTTSSTRLASAGSVRFKTGGLADAGLNNVMSVLSNPANNAMNPFLFCPAGQAATLPCWRTSAYAGGTVTWGATLTTSMSGSYWTVTSTAEHPNPTGPNTTPVRRRITARVPIYPTLTQPLNNPSWNYIYATRPASPLPTCDMTLQQSVQVASPLYVNGNLCLQNSATITRGPLVVRGRLTLNSQSNSVGSSSIRISEAFIGNGCEWVWGKKLDTPCKGDVNNVWVQAGKMLSSAPNLTPPVPDWNKWYLNASPGPQYPCVDRSGVPPVFDSPVAPGWETDANKLSFRNNNQPTFHLTPPVSYTCRTPGGELSWNAATRVLTVRGTIFIDGSAFIQNGVVNEYNGQATLYLSGTFFMKNSGLCGGLNAARNACDTVNWNPNTELLCIVTNAQGGQVNANTGVQLVSSSFQGAVQAAFAVEADTTSRIDGPIIGSTVAIGQSSNTSFPTISVVPVGMPSNPAVYAQPQPPQMYSG